MNRSDILNFFTKTKLLQLLEKLSYKDARKSWSKDRLIACFDETPIKEILLQCTHKQCQDILSFFDSSAQGTKEKCIQQILGLIKESGRKYTREDFLPALPAHCGHNNNTAAQFCTTCGKKIPKVTLEHFKNWFYQWLLGRIEDAYYDGMVLSEELYVVFAPIEELEYFEATAGQFVEYDDEGGVYTFVAYEYTTNLDSKRSTDEEYHYNTLPYFDDCDYSGPDPVKLQKMLHLIIPRDEQFTPSFTCDVNSELLKNSLDKVFPSEEECILTVLSAFTLRDANL